MENVLGVLKDLGLHEDLQGLVEARLEYLSADDKAFHERLQAIANKIEPEITSADDWHSAVAILHVDFQDEINHTNKFKCIKLLSQLRTKYNPEETYTGELQCTLKFSGMRLRFPDKRFLIFDVETLKHWLGDDKVLFFFEAAAGQKTT